MEVWERDSGVRVWGETGRSAERDRDRRRSGDRQVCVGGWGGVGGEAVRSGERLGSQQRQWSLGWCGGKTVGYGERQGGLDRDSEV